MSTMLSLPGAGVARTLGRSVIKKGRQVKAADLRLM